MKPIIAMASSFAAQAPIQAIAVAAVMLTSPAITFAKPVVFSAAGKAPSDIQASVDAFRNFLGANNGVGGTFGGGRREINWDGVPDALSAPNNMPANFFNANSPRGAVFFTPGSGFQVSANAGVAPIEFDNLRPNSSRKFKVFSPQRLFTAFNSTIVELSSSCQVRSSRRPLKGSVPSSPTWIVRRVRRSNISMPTGRF